MARYADSMLRTTTLFFLIFTLACGDDDTSTDVGPATDAPASDAPMADAPATDAPATDAPASDAPMADAPAEDAAPAGCGGFAGATCADTEYCDFPDNLCGGADGLGECVPRPDACAGVDDPVCGCDGTVYGSICNANVAGQDVNGLGGCDAPAESFECGSRFCPTTSYCQIVVDDTGLPPEFHCGPLPAACGGAADCSCVEAEPCGDICSADASGNVTLTCPGG